MIIPVNLCLIGKFALLLTPGMLWRKVYQALKKLLGSKSDEVILGKDFMKHENENAANLHKGLKRREFMVMLAGCTAGLMVPNLFHGEGKVAAATASVSDRLGKLLPLLLIAVVGLLRRRAPMGPLAPHGLGPLPRATFTAFFDFKWFVLVKIVIRGRLGLYILVAFDVL